MILYTHPTYYKMIHLMLSSFRKNQKINLLDYGCGNGYLFSILPKEKINKYSGYDVSKNSIETAKKIINYKNASFKLIDPEKPLNLGDSNSEDVVIAIGVLQYLKDEEIDAFINESHKVLKKGGILLISTVVDHIIYKILNIYGLVLPNKFINRDNIIKKLKNANFNVEYQKESGLIIGPLVSHNLTIIPDALDKIFFSTKGSLGIFGGTFRKISTPLMALENLVPLDYGYTLYIKARKD